MWLISTRKDGSFSVKSCIRGWFCKPDPTNPSSDRIQDILKLSALELVGSGLLKAVVLRLVGSALRDYATGYHVCKDISEASTGEQLLCQCENGNCADLFAVVAVKRLL